MYRNFFQALLPEVSAAVLGETIHWNYHDQIGRTSRVLQCLVFSKGPHTGKMILNSMNFQSCKIQYIFNGWVKSMKNKTEGFFHEKPHPIKAIWKSAIRQTDIYLAFVGYGNPWNEKNV